MKGIIINTETGDLKVSGGTLQVAPCEHDIVERVLVCVRGELKETPLIGGEVTLLSASGYDPFYAGRIRSMLKAVGIDCTSVGITPDGIITIK